MDFLKTFLNDLSDGKVSINLSKMKEEITEKIKERNLLSCTENKIERGKHVIRYIGIIAESLAKSIEQERDGENTEEFESDSEEVESVSEQGSEKDTEECNDDFCMIKRS